MVLVFEYALIERKGGWKMIYFSGRTEENVKRRGGKGRSDKYPWMIDPVDGSQEAADIKARDVRGENVEF